MPQALFLRPQVADVRSRDANLEGYAFRHANAVRAELLNLRGVVCHQLDRAYTEDPQHACGALVTAKIRRKTEGAVRVDRVEAVILKMVCRNLVDDADAPSLLGEVQEDAFGCPPESLQRGVLLPSDLPLHEGDVLFSGEGADERVDLEVAVPGREPCLATEQNVVAEFAFETRHVPRFRQFRRI